MSPPLLALVSNVKSMLWAALVTVLGNKSPILTVVGVTENEMEGLTVEADSDGP